MKKMIFGILLVFVAFSFNATSQDKTLKVGFVNVETILTEMPAAKKADQELQSLGKSYQDTLVQMQTDFQTKLETYQKQQSMMAPEKKQEEEASLQAMQQQILMYREEKFGQQGQLAVLREQYLQPIRDDVKAAVETVAKEEGLNMVFDATGASVWYFEDRFDITFKVLDRIKRGSGTN